MPHLAQLPSEDRFHAITSYWSRPISMTPHVTMGGLPSRIVDIASVDVTNTRIHSDLATAWQGIIGPDELDQLWAYIRSRARE